jgi:hypothetical protein
MNEYERQAFEELTKWQVKMQGKPSFFNEATRKTQARINKLIPEKIHKAITETIKQLIKAVIIGTRFTTGNPKVVISLEETEKNVRECITFYQTAAAAEGGVTGAGGILLGFVDFPAWLTLKMKMLFKIARLYGYDTKDFRERIFLLYIFQMTFTRQSRRQELYPTLVNWEKDSQQFNDINAFDWRRFQQEYRDYIDVAKLFQLIPWVGAAVGAIVNHRLTKRLGLTAINAYRMRYFRSSGELIPHK